MASPSGSARPGIPRPAAPAGGPGEARQHYLVTFAVLAVAALGYIVLQSMVLPALPAFAHDLHVSEDTATWALTAYLLSASVATPIFGRLGDIHGKERMLVAVLAVLLVGTLICALATSFALLIVGRLVQGMSGAIFPLAYGIVRDEFPRDRVAAGIGFLSVLVGVGSGAGFLLGGLIIEHLSWHWLFWAPLPVLVVSLVATTRYIPESPVRSAGGISMLPAFLLSGWLVALLLAVSEGPSLGWWSPAVVSLEVLAIVLAVAWVRSELAARYPLVDMRMMRNPTVWWTNLSTLLVGAGMYALIVVIPPFVETAPSHGYGFAASPVRAGSFLLPQALGMLVIGLYNGPITKAIGSKVAVFVGSVLGAAGFGSLVIAHQHPWQIYFGTAVVGVSIGLCVSALPNLIVDAVASSETGIATGMNANIRTVGGAIGSQLVATILASGVALGAAPAVHSYAVSFAVVGGFFLLGGVLALPAPGRTGVMAEPAPTSGQLA